MFRRQGINAAGSGFDETGATLLGTLDNTTLSIKLVLVFLLDKLTAFFRCGKKMYVASCI